MNSRIPGVRLAPAAEALPKENRALDLGAFLRARRENLNPARLGLPWIGVRRTPGLRREEVAQLAGIGITWYTKLEQGRPVQSSAKVMMAIAEALQCNEAEISHLFTLAGLGKPPASARPICAHLSAATKTILDQLDPIPAVIQNARFDIVGFNQAYCRMTNIDIARLPEADRNCFYLAFTNPAWRACLIEWPTIMPRMVALFRAAMTENSQDPHWDAMLRRLLDASPEFRVTWQRNEVYGVENHLKHYRNPHVGLLNLHQTNWWSAPKNGDRMLVYVPADQASEDGLKQLATMPMPTDRSL